jgi:O-methyltransferase
METPLDPAYARRLHAFRKQLLEDLAAIELASLRDGFPHEQILPKATYAPWRADAAFIKLYEKVRGNTLIDVYRLYELYELAGSPAASAGDFLEVGVWRGGSAAIIGTRAQLFPDAKLWLADTFSGVPQAPSSHDTLYQGGEHADTSIGEVQRVLRDCGVLNYEILQGLFPKDTGSTVADRTFRFAHIDVDSYESASQTFDWVWPRMVVGGLVIFDDYGFWGCEGVAAFVNRLKEKGAPVIHNLNGHAILWKSSATA